MWRVVTQIHILVLYCLIPTIAPWDVYYYLNFKEMKSLNKLVKIIVLIDHKNSLSLIVVLFLSFLLSSLPLHISISTLFILNHSLSPFFNSLTLSTLFISLSPHSLLFAVLLSVHLILFSLSFSFHVLLIHQQRNKYIVIYLYKKNPPNKEN